jgi:hypothetical protein
MILEYSVKKTFTESIDIVDPGNTCLRCITDEQADYIIFIKTVQGKTSILTIGPIFPDLPNMLLNDLSLNYNVFKYNYKKITKTIENFVNNGRKNIVKVEEIVELDGFEELPNFKEAFLALSE